MNSNPIGVFDSGIGGLTAVKRLIQLLPNEDVIYLGDTGRVPYGSRSRETIIKYARQDAAFLLRHGIKAMIIACNTVSSTAFDFESGFAGFTDIINTGLQPGRRNGDASRDAPVPVFDVIEPPSALAAASTKNGKIGVIGTTATVRSGAYERAIGRLLPGAEVTSAACPLFVPLAENGRTSPDDLAVMTIARDYLARLSGSGADTVILGCTHYPLLRGAIAEILGGGVTLIDSGAATAEYAAARLGELDLRSPSPAPGVRRYFVTDDAEGFEALASRFLGSDVRGLTEQVSLE
ncbi:MAG: glutamate racemase [Oscillospiraceae bacterium]|jgi:glutamate racemase|nr:glutamate racemase [Oscillospiraceae bacterium]